MRGREPPANSIGSETITSGRHVAHASSTPGSAARASIPPNTSDSRRTCACFERQLAHRREDRGRDAAGASANGHTSKPAARVCSADDSRVATSTSPPARRTASANGTSGPR